MSKDRLKQIDKLLKQYSKKINPLVEERRLLNEEADLKKAKLQVGKCFKFRNGNSLGKWDLYIKVIGVKEDGTIIFIDVEKDDRGKIRLEQEHHYSYMVSDSYVPITSEEFDEAFIRLTSELLCSVPTNIPYNITTIPIKSQKNLSAKPDGKSQ